MDMRRRVRTRASFSEILEEEESEEDVLVNTIIRKIGELTEETIKLVGYQEWIERYEKALKSRCPVIILHFNIRDFRAPAIHLAYEVLKSPILVLHYSGPIKTFFYPKSPETGYSVDFMTFLQTELPRGRARLIVLDFDLLKEAGTSPTLRALKGFTTTSYADGNKLIIMTEAIEDVPKSIASAATIIELPYPDFKTRIRLAKKFIKYLEERGLKYGGKPEQLAFFLGGLSYFNIMEVASAVAARLESSGRKIVRTEDIAMEKRERTEQLRAYLDPVEPDFKWRWYKNFLIKKIFERDIILPITKFTEAKEFGASVATGILLMGPPGTGKTVAVKALADRLKYVPVFELCLPKIMSSLLGETNKRFHMALRNAANSAPCILFLDEIDTVFQKRELGGSVGGTSDVMRQLQGDLFRFMEGEARKKTVVIIAATNRPQMLDEALISRFRIRLPVLIPKTPREREEILISLLEIKAEKGAKLDDSVWDAVKELAVRLEWYSPRDLRNIVDIAANNALKRYITEGGKMAITGEDLLQAAEEVKPPSRDVLEEDERVALRYASHK